MADRIKKLALEIEPEIISIRRRIHQYPELALQEFETAKLAEDTLRKLGMDEVRTGVGKTGVVGLLRGGEAKRTIALRADMDALPITEQTTHGFRSVYPDIMHACGHDAHTAMLLGAARILVAEKERLKGNIKFIFQPSEESPLGGAVDLIAEGVLENPRVDAILGLHVDPGLPAGKIGYREGAFYAVAGGFSIEIGGKAGHGALPHQATDAILMAAEVIQALQTIASSRIDPMEPFVLSIGTIHGGYNANIIAETVTLTGTVRCFDGDLLKKAGAMMEKTVSAITGAHGGKYCFQFRAGSRPLINDPGITAIVKKAAVKLVGPEQVSEVSRVLLGEDFVCYSEAVPASFASLGVAFKDAANYPLHHPQFDIDERALAIGAALFADAAIDYLAGAG